ncbi:MAG: S8 family serine peptidase [Candidatus Sericytochromatia bacterium]|nr:S8 family serine peptidase [Candidatus Sericytochromatia bacterium]
MNGASLLAWLPGRTPWPHRWLEVRKAWTLSRGAPWVRVAVVDTGIDDAHPDLRGKVVGGCDVVAAGGRHLDDLGHGTAVAGLIASRGWRSPETAGVAPLVSLLAIKVNHHGTGHVRAEHIAAGIRAALREGASVINLSVGVVAGEEFLTAASVADLGRAVREALAAGVPVVCAAGPSRGATVWPGAWAHDPAFAGLITVGAADRWGRVAPVSQGSPRHLLLAPAEGVVSLSTDARVAPFGGTSAAAPFVTGIVSLLRTLHPHAEPARIRSWVLAGARNGMASASGALTEAGNA